jgi:hypothetical protein
MSIHFFPEERGRMFLRNFVKFVLGFLCLEAKDFETFQSCSLVFFFFFARWSV